MFIVLGETGGTIAGCGGWDRWREAAVRAPEGSISTDRARRKVMTFTLTSPAFRSGQPIPGRHYDGPDQHPGDKPHTYRFRLAALGIANLPIGPEPDALMVWQAARENMLGEAELIGTYE
jgi:phosphatidylethanolamine-binding protein (PEBP) family uncharacterized protein